MMNWLIRVPPRVNGCFLELWISRHASWKKRKTEATKDRKPNVVTAIRPVLNCGMFDNGSKVVGQVTMVQSSEAIFYGPSVRYLSGDEVVVVHSQAEITSQQDKPSALYRSGETQRGRVLMFP